MTQNYVTFYDNVKVCVSKTFLIKMSFFKSFQKIQKFFKQWKTLITLS
jgi:hypothetical protein